MLLSSTRHSEHSNLQVVISTNRQLEYNDTYLDFDVISFALLLDELIPIVINIAVNVKKLLGLFKKEETTVVTEEIPRGFTRNGQYYGYEEFYHSEGVMRVGYKTRGGKWAMMIDNQTDVKEARKKMVKLFSEVQNRIV